MAALHLAVLIGAPRLEVPMPDAAPLDGEEEGEGELRAVVGLHLPDGKRERRADLVQEVEAGQGVLASIEAQDAKPGAIIARRVLVGLGGPELDHLDVHLDRLAGRGLLEKLELATPRGAVWAVAPGEGPGRRKSA